MCMYILYVNVYVYETICICKCICKCTLWNLGEALSSPLPEKQTKGSRVSATHCTQRRLTLYATPWSLKRGRHCGSLSFFRQDCGPVFGPGFWPHERANRSCSTVLMPGFRPFAGASLPSAMQAAMDTHIRIMLWGDMAQKLFWISEKGPSGAARSHANLLRSGSMPPLQRFCQQAVLRASWEKCVACNCCRASRPRALECTVYGQSAKRDVIPYLHAGLRGVIGTYEGHNQGWEGRNPFFTCGLELGCNRDVRGSKPQMGRT